MVKLSAETNPSEHGFEYQYLEFKSKFLHQ